VDEIKSEGGHRNTFLKNDHRCNIRFAGLRPKNEKEISEIDLN
jgi:hypothetical protein